MRRAPLGAAAPMARRWTFVALVALLAVSCGAPLKPIVLPAGVGGPASDAPEALDAATAACRAVSTLSAQVGVAGSIAGKRAPHARLLIAVAAPGSARIEAPAPFGAPVFILVARDNDATLLFPRENQALEHGRPADLLEALTGIPVDGAGLRAALTGCGVAPDARRALQYDDNWIAVPDQDGTLYLHREASSPSWRVAAAVHDAGASRWRVDYREFARGLPRAIHVFAVTGGRFDLRLSLSDVELNPALGADVFSVRVPASAAPLTLDDLRTREPRQ